MCKVPFYLEGNIFAGSGDEDVAIFGGVSLFSLLKQGKNGTHTFPQDGCKSELFVALFSRGTTLRSSLTALPGFYPTYSVSFPPLQFPSNKSHARKNPCLRLCF